MFREVKLCGMTIAMSKSKIVPHHYRESVLKAVSRIAHYIRFSFQKQFPDSVRHSLGQLCHAFPSPTCLKRNDLFVAWFVNERAQSMVTYVRWTHASFRISSVVNDERCMSGRADTEYRITLYTTDWISNSRGKYCRPDVYVEHTKYLAPYRHVRCHPTRKVRSTARNRSAKTSLLLDTNTCMCMRARACLFR